MKKVVLLLLSLFGLPGLAALFPAASLALGVAMGPTTVDIASAVRGGEYERSVTVFNPGDAEMEYTLRVEGGAGAWISLLDLDTGQAVQGLTIAARSNATLRLQVKVPSDVPNGSYSATIYAETRPVASTAETGVSTVMQAKSLLTVAVTDVETVDGAFLSVSARDTEAGLPLRLDVDFGNTGNIAITPRIACDVNQGDAKVAGFIHAETTVKPGTMETIRVEWADTAGLNGDYVAAVTVSFNDRIFGTREVPFRVLPAGSLTKTGELTSLAYEGDTQVGATIKLLGSFNSTGQADCRAKLMVETYCDGQLADAVQSEETLVPVGDTGKLTTYWKPAKAGEYLLKGYVAYDGKQTDTKEVSFTVTGESSKLGGALPFVIGGVGGALGIAAVAAVVWWSRRSSAGSRKAYAPSRNGRRYV